MNRTHLLRIFAGIASIVAFAALATETLVGSWQGQVLINYRPIPVTIKIDQDSKSGQVAGVLEYGKPWQCSLNLEYSGEIPGVDTKVFSLSVPLVGPAPGPRCKQLIDGFLDVTKQLDNSISVNIQTKLNQQKETLTLKRNN